MNKINIILVVSWRLKVWVQTQHLLDKMVALLLKTLPSSIFTGIQTFPITAVDWLWRRWPVIHVIITIRKHYTWQHNEIYSIIYKCICLHLRENKVVYAAINTIRTWKMMPTPTGQTKNLLVTWSLWKQLLSC